MTLNECSAKTFVRPGLWKLKLKDFLKDKPELHTALQLTLGFDLSNRLEAAYSRQ